ncbi:MAG: citramalate synthase [Chloroflexi bacterium]|nr:citramalate synthase [Chloroflexota bacterium]
MPTVALYDTTLRDGAQQEGISLSLEDKLKITRKLDELGVPFVEGGWPGSNPKDDEYFRAVRDISLSSVTIAAFGSTRRAGIAPEADPNLRAMLDSQAPVVTLVGKSWDLHVTRILETTLEENLAMIADSVAFLCRQGRRVFFDAEHFFDGFRANAAYAVRCARVAAEAGAEVVILCDTNGGSLPSQVRDMVQRVGKEVSVPLGIHAHNDCDVAVAGSLAAVEAGAVQVQGTVNGYGERCGNANLLSVAANLKLKLGIPCLTEQQLARLTEVHRYVSEVVNLPPHAQQPYVGSSAFGHKAGLHGSAVAKLEDSYQHIKPLAVGNATRMLISELAGKGNITYKLKELGLGVAVSPSAVGTLVEEIKLKESQGFQYEGAEASFELLVRRTLAGYKPPFQLMDYRVIVEQRRALAGPGADDLLAEATVKVRVGSEVRHTAAVGNGPVNALDVALRKALMEDYPELKRVRLVDYKVRVVNQGAGTGATVRVLIESTDGEHTWQTVGSSANIIEASWLALVDGVEYWLLRYGGGL